MRCCPNCIWGELDCNGSHREPWQLHPLCWPLRAQISLGYLTLPPRPSLDALSEANKPIDRASVPSAFSLEPVLGTQWSGRAVYFCLLWLVSGSHLCVLVTHGITTVATSLPAGVQLGFVMHAFGHCGLGQGPGSGGFQQVHASEVRGWK